MAPSAGPAPNRSGPSAASLLAGLGVATFVLGAPAIHVAHARPDSAAISLGLRLALPVVGGLAGLGLAGRQLPGQHHGLRQVDEAFGLMVTGGVAGGPRHSRFPDMLGSCG